MKLLVAKDVAAMLGIGRHEIPILVKAGMPVVRIHGKRRDYFTAEGVEKFIKACTVSGHLSGQIDEPEPDEIDQNSPNVATFKTARTGRKIASAVRKPLPRDWRKQYAR